MTKLDNLKDVYDHLQQRAPEVIDLATASTDEEFAAFLDRLLERAACEMEASSSQFCDLDEVGLSACVAMSLNGMPGVRVIREGYSNGHVDLTITV